MTAKSNSHELAVLVKYYHRIAKWCGALIVGIWMLSMSTQDGYQHNWNEISYWICVWIHVSHCLYLWTKEPYTNCTGKLPTNHIAKQHGAGWLLWYSGWNWKHTFWILNSDSGGWGRANSSSQSWIEPNSSKVYSETVVSLQVIIIDNGDINTGSGACPHWKAEIQWGSTEVHIKA